MAQDIVPIELGLPQGDLVTLWAPRWREDGEEWEAFLGHEDDLYAFPDTPHLAAFVRGDDEHDLTDHPAWHVVPALSVAELTPDEEHQYDLVGVPELVSEEPDTWVLSELADIVAMIRSLADVCELEQVHQILDSANGFGLLEQGTLPFSGREGQVLWTELAEVVAEKWDDLLDAIDDVVTVPEVDEKALATAQTEFAELEAQEANEEEDADDPLDAHEEEAAEKTAVAAAEADEEEAEEEEEELGFWAEVGIDPIKIVTAEHEYYTLRCYLGDDPLFLGSKGKIDVFKSVKALVRSLVDASPDDPGNDLSKVATWTDVLAAATDGSVAPIEIVESNLYVLTGIEDDIEDGIDAIDPTQLDLAVELITDAAEWAGDESAAKALSQSESLGWLVSFVVQPDPNRLAPSAPFDQEVTAWKKLLSDFEARLNER
jgi:hypothetical protein